MNKPSKRSTQLIFLTVPDINLSLGPSKHRDDRKETGGLAVHSFLSNFVSVDWEPGPRPHKGPVSGLGEVWEAH